MSRWSKRSAEENARIQAQHRERQSNGEVNQSSVMSDPFNQSEIADILKAHEIPLRCPECFNWTGSDKYIIERRESPFGKSYDTYAGTCRICGATARRATFVGDSMDAVMMMVASILIADGRMKDAREK